MICSPVAPHDPELNPIEEIWAIIKAIVASRNGISAFRPIRAAAWVYNGCAHVSYGVPVRHHPTMWTRIDTDVIKWENDTLELSELSDYEDDDTSSAIAML